MNNTCASINKLLKLPGIGIWWNESPDVVHGIPQFITGFMWIFGSPVSLVDSSIIKQLRKKLKD
jgi:hypothetical protein